MKSRKTRSQLRAIDGIFLLDKPSGMSSNAALQKALTLFNAQKAGHTGSLDPLATGLLPICFGEATKIAGFLLGSRKAYEAQVQLGIVTDTDDAEGQVLRHRPVPILDAHAVERAIKPFIGRIKQRAPIYSALKQGGEPLYAKARRGDPVEAPERDVDIFSIELLSLVGSILNLRITCGAGMYVRSLARDLGEALGCGAHVIGLRRLWIEPFRQPVMITLEQLETQLTNPADPSAVIDQLILPIAAGLSDWLQLTLSEPEVTQLSYGQFVERTDIADGQAAALTADGKVVALVDIQNGLIKPRRVFAIQQTDYPAKK